MTAQKDEVRLSRIQNLLAVLEHVFNAFLNFPDLSLRASPETWGVKHDSVVLIAAPLFTPDKFHCIIADPADSARIFRKCLILLRPFDDPVGGVRWQVSAPEDDMASVAPPE